MEWLRNKKHRLLVSLCAGMLFAILMTGGAKLPEERGSLAWWGTLYPQFCFGEKEEGIKEKEESPRLKISFWLARVLDW